MKVVYSNTTIGYVEGGMSEFVYTKFRSRKVVVCRIVDRKDIAGKCPEITLQMIYKDADGREPFNGLDGAVNWNVIDTTHFTGAITDRFMCNYPTMELIDMHCEDYGLKDFVNDGSESFYQMQEDNQYLSDFIMAYYCGELRDGKDKMRFLRKISNARTFGTNKILNKRVKYYIETNKLEFVY